MAVVATVSSTEHICYFNFLVDLSEFYLPVEGKLLVSFKC